MKNLYIIGNGFDLHHGLDTRYQSFAEFLRQKKFEIYEQMLHYYGLPDTDEEDLTAWSNFENALSELNYEEVLDDNTDLIANPSNPDFRDRDWHTFQIEMEMVVAKLTTELCETFRQFLLQTSFPKTIHESKYLSIQNDAIFLNFNYTDTLERYYNVEEKNICYIHNKAKRVSSPIILGHGINPSTFEQKPQSPSTPPEGLSDEEMEYWYDEMSNNYDYSYESAKSELLTYFKRSFKDTNSVISDNKEFFNKLSEVEIIFVLGHSLSKIDKPYFEEVVRCVDKNAKWVVSYYSDNDKMNHMASLLDLKVREENITQVKLQELVKSK